MSDATSKVPPGTPSHPAAMPGALDTKPIHIEQPIGGSQAAHTDIEAGSVYTLSKGSAQTMFTPFARGLLTEKMSGEQADGAQAVSTLFGQMANTLSGQTPNRPLNTPEDEPPRVCLVRPTPWTRNQQKILSLFRAQGHCIVQLKVVAETLDIPYGTVRNIIKRLAEAGIIRACAYRAADLQGLEVWFCGPREGICEESEPEAGLPKAGELPDESTSAQTVWTQPEHTPHIKVRERERRKKSISLDSVCRRNTGAMAPCS